MRGNLHSAQNTKQRHRYRNKEDQGHHQQTAKHAYIALLKVVSEPILSTWLKFHLRYPLYTFLDLLRLQQQLLLLILLTPTSTL